MAHPVSYPGFLVTEHQPHGYPRLGLAAHTLELRYRKGASVARLRRRLEDWEAGQGNLWFEARNLERLPAELAYELVHVYVALREWYPAVRPDFVDFCAVHKGKTLAEASAYSENWPALRRFAADTGAETSEELEEELALWDGDDEADDDIAEAVAELEYLQRMSAHERPVNITATGAITLGRWMSTKKGYGELLEYWERRNRRAAAAGRPLRVPETSVSAAALVLIHEFGHLADDALAGRGMRQAEPVWARLSQAVYGGPRPKLSDWGWHLLNYPSISNNIVGPARGGKRRAQLVKRARKLDIGFTLGSYAPTYRDEVFAEAFMLSWAARDPALRRQLRVLRDGLVSAGVGRKRAPRKRTPHKRVDKSDKKVAK